MDVPPCLCRGWPNALLLHTDKGGQANTKAKQRSIPPARASSQRFGWRPSYKAAGGNGPVLRACPSSHPRPKTRRPSSRRHAHSSKQQQSRGKAKGTAIHAPTSTPRQCRGRPISKSVHSRPGATAPKRNEGWGDARGVMDGCRHLLVVHPLGTTRWRWCVAELPGCRVG